MQCESKNRHVLSPIIIVFNVVFSFQDLVTIVHRQAKINEEQSRTIEEQTMTIDRQSALIEVCALLGTNKTTTVWTFEK